MLELKGVIKKYQTKAGAVNALNGVSLTLPSSGLVFISGKSGCGKTTLLNVIGGLDGIDGGEIYVQDKKFSSFSAQEYDSYRNTFIGFIFQEYNLLSEFTVENNIKMAMELQGQPVDEEELEKLLKEMDIFELKNRKPSELSGGQRQRVAIARALVKQPRIIMADEPTGALDSGTGMQVLETLKRLSKDKLVIVVSHDREFAEKYADRIIRLVDGEIVEDITFTERDIKENIYERENSFIVREGAELLSDEKEALARAIKTRKKIEITDSLSFRDKQKTGEVKRAETTPVAFKTSKMKLKSSFGLGVKSLTVKPIRLIITILISALAFAVFGLFDTIANFSTQKILRNQLRSLSDTVVTSASYTVNHEAGDKYALKVSGQTLDSLSNETGGKVKGIYDFADNTAGYVTHTQTINELRNSFISLGRKYYSNHVNGFIEFDGETELNADGSFKDFEYKLVLGEYPKLETEKEEGEENFRQVAVSTYLADSIIFYLNGQTLNEMEILKREDLLEKPITIGQARYEIVGIIDCGAIPEKYDALRTSAPSGISTSALNDAFQAYINSGAWKCLFVPYGFMEASNAELNSANIFYVGNAKWTLSMTDTHARKQLTEYVYNSEEFTQENIVRFDGKYAENNAVSLADDEILVHHLNLSSLFANEIYKLQISEKTVAMDLIRSMEYYAKLGQKQDKINELLQLLKINPQNIKTTISQTSTETGETVVKEVKIVGAYFNVDTAKYVTSETYKLMMNENLMRSFHIYTWQGDYNKILFSAKSVRSGADTIVNYLTARQGLTMNLYNNSVLSVIGDNELMIKQVADLFLYVALALAVFSVFMLYNYISTSISNKKRSVGVLRGLGAGSKDVLRIFLSESLIIALVNSVLASVFSAIGCMLVNSYIMNTMHIFVQFALFGVRQILIISGISFALAFLSSALPIIKIAKKKPVELISRS